MGKFLTDINPIEHLPERNKYKLCANELYKDDDGTIYLAWRNFCTDNFTWINSNFWDIRASHIHDIGCKYHQVVKVKLNEQELRSMRYLAAFNNKMVCKDIPSKFLEVIDISGHEINNMFYRMLKCADCPKTPKYIQCLYRTGVCLNFKWFLTGKKKIELDKLYDEDWNRK